MKPLPRIIFCIATLFVALAICPKPVWIIDASPSPRPGGFQFDGKISRQVLENYLSRSMCIEGLLNGRGPLADDIRMITNCGARDIARALCLWGAENNFFADSQRGKA